MESKRFLEWLKSNSIQRVPGALNSRPLLGLVFNDAGGSQAVARIYIL